ncbi:MAG: hypothetical protein E6J41_26455 [Chloroflexi bacterium]|nr:MAG: hypothetical protein E6J41_26455 [Chloroflexota bacterium]
MTWDSYGRSGGRRRGVVLVGALAIGLAAGAVLERIAAPPARNPTPASAPATTTGVLGAGPTRVVDGVPVGYAHTAQGAAQAAGNYLAVLGGPLALNPSRLQAALDQVADPATRAKLDASTRSSLRAEDSLWGVQSAAEQGRHVLLTQTPIAYRVAAYTTAEASVSVWLVTTVGVENRQRLVAFFGIGTATLAWLDGDWRLRAVDAGSQAGDVVPAAMQTPTPTGGVPAKLDGFVPYGG